MASTGQNQQPSAGAPTTNEKKPISENPPPKRPADGEVLFVSSNPVKKPRAAQGTMPGRPHALPTVCQPSAALPPPGVVTSLQPTAPIPDMSLENPSVSLPDFGNFTFPPSQTPMGLPQSRRLSEAVSPKQLPQTISPILLQPGYSAQQPLGMSLGSNVRLDPISCLDFNNTSSVPGLDLSKLLSDTTNGDGNETPQVLTSPGLGSMGTQNAIPFTMYSTGNIVPIPLSQHPYMPHGTAPHSTASSGPPQSPAPMFSPGRTTTSGGPGLSLNTRSHESRPVAYTPLPLQTVQKTPCFVCTQPRQGSPPRNAAHGSTFHHHNHPSAVGFSPRPVGAMAPQTALSTTIPSVIPLSSTPRSTPISEASQKKKYAQNLLVDIAETAETSFPYAEVAARHGVVPARVAEALAGVLLLPLVRCATDKRRAGWLAHERMKEYREARQIWQGQGGQGEDHQSESVSVRQMATYLGGQYFEGQGKGDKV